MGSNGTVDERLAEAEAARAVLGAAWRVNLRWPDRAHRRHARSRPRRRRARPAGAAARRGASRTGPIGIPITSPRARCSDRRGLQRRPAPLSTRQGEPWKPEWICYYFINDSAPPSFVVDVSRALRAPSAARWRAT